MEGQMFRRDGFWLWGSSLIFWLVLVPVSKAGEQELRDIQAFCPMPLMKAEFRNVAGIALIDTGFSDGVVFDSPSIDLDVEGFEKTETRLNASFGKHIASAWTQVPFDLAAVHFPGVTAIRNDLTPVRNFVSQCEFIAGMECCYGRTLAFDANSQNVRLYSSAESSVAGEAMPLRWSRFKCPMVEVRLPTLGGVHVLLDTGSTGTISLTEERLESLARMGHAVKITQRRKAIDGVGNVDQAGKRFVIRNLNIAGTTFINLPVSIGEAEHIGTGLLRYFDVTLDFSRNTLRVRLPPEQQTPIQVPPRASGMFSQAVGIDRIRISEIEERSPAEIAGLKVDDIIHAIDGQPVSKYPYWDRVDVFSQAGTTLKLVVERDGEHREVALKLRYDFAYPPEWPPEAPEFNPD